MAQRLLPCAKTDVQRVPATEVLLNNSTVADQIREGDDDSGLRRRVMVSCLGFVAGFSTIFILVKSFIFFAIHECVIKVG